MLIWIEAADRFAIHAAMKLLQTAVELSAFRETEGRSVFSYTAQRDELYLI
jgi:hypothetical protein